MGSRSLFSNSLRIGKATLLFPYNQTPFGITQLRNLSASVRLSNTGHAQLNNFKVCRFISSNCSLKSPNVVFPEAEAKHLALIDSVTNLQEKRLIEVVFKGKSSGQYLYPYIWLRDNCQCPKCFDPITQSRIMLFEDLKLDVHPLAIKNTNDSTLEIQWSDGHTSPYTSDWLQERGFAGDQRKKRLSVSKLRKIYLGSNVIEKLPTADFGELMTDDRALLTWLQRLEIYGFVLIKNAAAEYGQIRKLVDRVAFIKKTHYGAEFVVKAKPDPSNVAYSSGQLQLHTDLPYYDYKPGVQFIHCIIQFELVGGISQIADAGHVARQLKKLHPEMFKILSETNVDWSDEGVDDGREYLKVLQRPVICLDAEGDIARINFSHPQRDSFFNVDLAVVSKWYEAMKTFHSMLYQDEYCLQFKMTPGTIQSFDNLRIVHGRTGYEEGRGQREIEGCYMDWDEVRSRRRVLEKKFNISSEKLIHHLGNELTVL